MKNKKVGTMIFLCIFSIIILLSGAYAIYNFDAITKSNTIGTEQISMNYTESNELSLNNALPISDTKGKQTNYFEFKVKTSIITNQIKNMNYNIVISPLTVNSNYTLYPTNKIKVYLTKMVNNNEEVVTGPTTIDKLNNYLLATETATFNKTIKEQEITYRVRTWIDFSFDAQLSNEKTYSYKFKINVNTDTITQDYALSFATKTA